MSQYQIYTRIISEVIRRSEFLVGENVPPSKIHHRLQQQYGKECLLRRHSSPYCCWTLWWISADGTFSPTRNLITMRCSTLRGTFCSLITLTTPRQDRTGSNPSRREVGGCGFNLSRSHSCCAVRLVYTQISPGHIWTTFYLFYIRYELCFRLPSHLSSLLHVSNIMCSSSGRPFIHAVFVACFSSIMSAV